MRAERPKLQAQFADLKRGLSQVSDSEWENLPEVGNLTGKRRKLNPREGRTYVVPDSVLVGDRDRGGYENALDPRQQMVREPPYERVYVLTCNSRTVGMKLQLKPGVWRISSASARRETRSFLSSSTR